MSCGHAEVFFVGMDELNEHRYTPHLQLCQCGLPDYHQNPSRKFLLQYNAAALPCRPKSNDATNTQ